MYLEGPIAYPIAKLLDYLLGESHGTMYRKIELKTLVGLHAHIGGDSLSEDEVTIISAVLDLSEKPVSFIMTPIADVYTLSSDVKLDRAKVDEVRWLVLRENPELKLTPSPTRRSSTSAILECPCIRRIGLPTSSACSSSRSSSPTILTSARRSARSLLPLCPRRFRGAPASMR
jgi:hypothetical protein